MSQDVFSRCVALKPTTKLDADDLYDKFYEYLDHTYGEYHAYSIQFGKDFVALYHHQDFEDHYGINRIDTVEEFIDLLVILIAVCGKHDIDVEDGLDPKYFTDFWYNGVDCSATNINWEDL